MDVHAHRKGAARVRFLDPQGRPLRNTPLQFSLTNHDFLFGCGAFDALPATAAVESGTISFYQDAPQTDRAFYQDRMEKWLSVFNYGTLPFYWGSFEPEEGRPLTESRRAAAQLLKGRGAVAKGHPLCWHTGCADWLLKYDNAAILDKQLERIHRDVSDFRGLIDMWDVINETVIMPVFDRYDNAVTRLCNDLGRIDLIRRVFDAAKAANPDAVLLINDFNLSEKYEEVIADCLNAGIPISAIGLQTHQHQGYMGRERLEEILERFSRFGLPLHFTENTLLSGQLMPGHIVDLNDYQVDTWPSTPEGEERQSAQWQEMYDILFAHPLVEAITGWDFADGAWLHAPSGLIREDNTPKPAFYALQEKIHTTWNSQGTMVTDAEGCGLLEGYFGHYTISGSAGSASCHLAKHGSCPKTLQLTR